MDRGIDALVNDSLVGISKLEDIFDEVFRVDKLLQP